VSVLCRGVDFARRGNLSEVVKMRKIIEFFRGFLRNPGIDRGREIPDYIKILQEIAEDSKL